MVVSIEEKAGPRSGQVRIKETSASEPLMTCRKEQRWRQNRVGLVNPGQVWELPAYGPDGVRHEGGVTLVQAFVRNVGTCRPDVKGDVRVEDP